MPAIFASIFNKAVTALGRKEQSSRHTPTLSSHSTVQICSMLELRPIISGDAQTEWGLGSQFIGIGFIGIGFTGIGVDRLRGFRKRPGECH
jgi:hypothetical protein